MISSGLHGGERFRIMPPLVICSAVAPERVSGAQAGDIVIEAVRGPRPRNS